MLFLRRLVIWLTSLIVQFDVLSKVELILCEDTRVSQKLLKHYNIDTPTKSYHMHNEHRTVDRLVEQLQQGMSMALISDAVHLRFPILGFCWSGHAYNRGQCH